MNLLEFMNKKLLLHTPGCHLFDDRLELVEFRMVQTDLFSKSLSLMWWIIILKEMYNCT